MASFLRGVLIRDAAGNGCEGRRLVNTAEIATVSESDGESALAHLRDGSKVRLDISFEDLGSIVDAACDQQLWTARELLRDPRRMFRSRS